jgi:hypothetical protein
MISTDRIRITTGKARLQLIALLCLAMIGQVPQSNPLSQSKNTGSSDLEKSAYFAFVDRNYIFTLEVVAPGVPLLNFVSMSDKPQSLSAKQVRLAVENRKVIAKSFLIDTGDPKQPITVPSVTMRARSSFGVRVQGDFGEEKEFSGVTVRVAEEEFSLAPLTSFAFENLVLKVNRINLGSPDFRDDWQILKLDVIGTRAPAPRR